MSIKKIITIEIEISEESSEGVVVSKSDTNQFLNDVVNNIQSFVGDGGLTSVNPFIELDSYDVSIQDTLDVPVFDISEEHFKASAKRLRPELELSGLKIGHAKSLQVLSQSLYAKPFEEIKETILKNKESKTICEDSNNHVALIDLGGEHVLFVNGEFEGATYNGLSTEISYGELFDQAHQFAKINHTQVEEMIIDINEYFDGEFEYEDLKTLFNIEGLIQSKDWELIRRLENVKISSINGVAFQYALNGNWRSEALSESDSLDEVKNHSIWTPENSTYEYFITISELVLAHKSEDNVWTINDNGELFSIEILK